MTRDSSKNDEDVGEEADLLARLSSAILEDDTSEIHSLVSKILEDETSIPDSLRPQLQKIHCRSLLSLHKYDKVIEYCSSSSLGDDARGQEERKALVLERVYALYKIGRYSDCIDIIGKSLKRIEVEGNSIGDSEEVERGLKHLLAQCHYRLQEMEEATQIYSNLLQNDIDADTDMMTNVLAASVANHSIPCSKTIDDHIKENIIAEIENGAKNNIDEDGEYEYPYELVFNYATHLLLTSTGLGQTKQAIELLSKAELECKAFHDKIADEQEEEEGGEEAVEVCKSVAFLKDSMPIKANMALGKMQSGDWSGAMKSYLDVAVTSRKGISGKNGATFHGGATSLVAEHNLAVLNSMRGSYSICDLMKKFPDFSSWEDATCKDTGHSHQLITPQQTRILLYNRALLFLRMSKVGEAKAIIQSLRTSLASTTGSNQNNKTRRQMESKKKRKKKNTSGGEYLAVPSTEADKMLWECRVALLEDISNGVNLSENTDCTTTTVANSIEAKLREKQNGGSTLDQAMLEYALAEVKLYKTQQFIVKQSSVVKDKEGKDIGASMRTEEKYIDALEELPSSIRHRPATVATLCALYGSLGMNDKAELVLDTSSSGSSGTSVAKKSMADFKLRLGRYEEAADIYESIINGETSSKEDAALSEEEIMECSAGLVKALSFFDVERAIGLAQDLTTDDDYTEGSFDGETLEAMEIPRLSKASGISSRSRKIIGADRETYVYWLFFMSCETVSSLLTFELILRVFLLFMCNIIGNERKRIRKQFCVAEPRNVNPTLRNYKKKVDIILIDPANPTQKGGYLRINDLTIDVVGGDGINLLEPKVVVLGLVLIKMQPNLMLQQELQPRHRVWISLVGNLAQLIWPYHQLDVDGAKNGLFLFQKTLFHMNKPK